MEITRPEKPRGFIGENIYVIPQQNQKELQINPVLRGFMVTDAGYFPKARGHFRRRERGCGQTICLVCTGGRGEVNIDNTLFPLEQGQALAIEQGTPHSYAAHAQEPWTLYWLHVTGDFVSHYIPRRVQNIPVSLPSFDQDGGNEHLYGLFASMFSWLSRGHSLPQILAASSLGGSILTQVFTTNPGLSLHVDGGLDRQLQPALVFIQHNLARPMDVSGLSALCGLSESRFSFLFRQLTGLPPMSYVAHQRIQRACYYLEATSESVAGVAELVGYGDQFYFSRLFRRITGKSPREYRGRG